MNKRNLARREKAKQLDADGWECAACKGTGTRGVRGHICRECNGRGHFVIIRPPISNTTKENGDE